MPYFSTIVIVLAVVILAAMMTPSKQVKTEPFQVDKAEWLFDMYLSVLGKNEEDLTDAERDSIWDKACNRCAMFLTWALMRGHGGEIHLKQEPDAVEAVRKREITGTEFFIKYCDCVLSREDFSDSILPFVDAYYFSRYLEEYDTIALQKQKTGQPEWGSTFSWEEFAVIEKTLDKAYRNWKFYERPIRIGKKRISS